MSKEYIWTFNDTALSSGLNGIFSLEYHIARAKLKIEPEALIGSKVWLIVRSGGVSFLYSVLSPFTVEIYRSGKYKDDFLVRCDPFSSVRFLPRYESRNSWRLQIRGDEEIRDCTDAERLELSGMVRKNHRIGFAPPSPAILDSVPHTVFGDIEHAVSDQLMLTLRTVSFGDASRSRYLPDSLFALSGIALIILKSIHPNLNEADMIALIAALDPIAKTDRGALFKSAKNLVKALSSLPPVVDTFLEEIDPEEISPRTFVARAEEFSLDWLDKTNDAEQTHERILKEFVLFLKSEGFATYKTRSFDLFVVKKNARFLFEIKSTNGFNTVSQGEKGIVQLLRYSTAFADNTVGNLRFVLLLQDSDQPAVFENLSRMAEHAGSEPWLYDEKREWPQRVFSTACKSFSELTEMV